MPVVMSIRRALGPVPKPLRELVNPAQSAPAWPDSFVLAVFPAKRNAAAVRRGADAGASGSASAALAGHRHRLTRNADIGTSSFSSLNPAHPASVGPFDAGGIGLTKHVLLWCR